MADICTACLCSGRNLYFIGETGYYHLYTQILNEIHVYDLTQVCVRVCWECRALLRRFQLFKQQVKHSYRRLLQHLHQNSPPSIANLTRPPHLQIYHAVKLDYPRDELKKELNIDESNVLDLGIDIVKNELEAARDNILDLGIDVKDELDTEIHRDNIEELDSVKSEIEAEMHCEPETFVNNLNLEKLRGKKKEAVKKPSKKIKKKSKVKVKKKRVSISSAESVALDSADSLSDLDSVLDYYREKEEPPEGDGEEKEEKKEELKCKECSKAFVNSVDLEKHINTEHIVKVVDKRNGEVSKAPRTNKDGTGERPQCVECGKIFSSRKTYRYHLNVLHKGQNRYPCPRCGKVYQWKSNLGRHMRSHKARDTGELYCTTCDKRFASVATYRQHLRVSRRHVSESEFSFMCNDCGKKFVNKTRLRDHIDWEHLKKIKFRCQLCNKPFKCHTSLYVHVQNVHRNKEKKDNLCHVCGKSYQNAAKLKYHIVAMHTSETPYQCQQCSAAFGWYSSLYRHVREVHYKMKLQPKKARKTKKSTNDVLPSLLPQQQIMPSIHQPGPP